MISEITIKISMLPEGVTISKEQTGITEEDFSVPPPPEGVQGMAEEDFSIPPPPEEAEPTSGEETNEVPETPSS